MSILAIESDSKMNTEQLCDAGRNKWFALRVKPRFEKTVATIARNKGYEEFLPLCRSRRRWSDRVQSVDLPLFPGYLFCQLNPEFRLPLLTIPGALHFIGIGRTPAPIDDQEIASLQAAMRSGLWAEPWPFLDVGQRVRLEEGPLAGLEGLLIEVRKKQRMIVSVTLLKRSVAVEIERDWVRPLDCSRTAFRSSLKPQLAAAATA
jgi:transcription antitermination factor NusG